MSAPATTSTPSRRTSSTSGRAPRTASGPRYYKTTYTPGRKERYANQPGENQTYYAAEPIDESEAPESLRDAEYTLPLWGRANYVNHERQENATFDYDDADQNDFYNASENWCWVRTSVPSH